MRLAAVVSAYLIGFTSWLFEPASGAPLPMAKATLPENIPR